MKKNVLLTPENTAVVYVRYSSHNQREESLDAQIRASEEFAKRKGLTVLKIYSDAAMSATNDNRPEFRKMIEDAKKKQFRYVIVHKLDRFSRDKFDAVTYKRELKVSGVSLLSVTENLDGSPESIILESLLEGLAQYFSANLAREVMKGLRENAHNCKHTGGFAPLGFNIDPDTKKLVINEAEAKIIKVIFEKYSNGMGYNALLEYLNGMGYKTKFGNSFAKNSLNTILKNEKYVGTLVYNKKKEKDAAGKRNAKLKPESEWIVVENGLPQIIDRETFDKVQLKLAGNTQNGGKFKAKEIYLLSGLIYCGECGSSIYGNTRMCGRNKSKYSSYRCSGRAQHQGCENKELRKEYLEGYVLDELYNRLFSDISIKKLSAMLSEYNQRKSVETSEELNHARGELDTVIGKINQIVNLVSVSGISVETVREELLKLEERKRFLEDYISEITMSGSAYMISEEKLLDLINKSKEFVQTRNAAECREFIQAYVEKVMVYAERVEVFFRIHVPDNETDAISPLKSEESIKILQKEYREVI